ncbi:MULTISPECIES: cystathionine beta-lyase [Streptococcus]|uniref:cystathionine beta-lyase n=1 Tax=Streptococcus TaxID=1301 RepID=UPI000CF5A706|nr:cystathionine beta-lyase [Streptococcus suis]MBM0194179.1 cystathionine beta-lyase [Streptococcus suis]MBM7316720.1 cystathionine beta-lyase [Streptococcus suis]HEM4859311.1 cystathionine beta-lyase [Streptococcus suis]HEM4897292.1 cystathionine beta-lyase [Streptococcus suis]HEM5029042.1 cystathionine beta-lyase [Streptococcus suis]
MTDYLDLAIKYGGFTSLDKVYLAKKFADLTDQQKLDFITPPPSVINAYFAEIYQKQGVEEATDYYLTLSQQLCLFPKEPSFEEDKPFVRLNLSGKSFGFAYVLADGLAQVFSEQDEEVTESLLFEIAQVFPHYVVFVEEGKIFMKANPFKDAELEEVETDYLLTQVEKAEGLVKISGFNQEEVLEVADGYAGQYYYIWSGRSAIIFIENRK